MSDTTSILTDYYDAVPYESHPFQQTAAEHLEALAFLFGLEPPAPSGARVLELGCAAGGNLIPFAARHPGASALGVDLSSVQVKAGVEAIAQAGLKNVELRVFDISKIDASFGKFDYIICHGVYSWVPTAVQEAILRVCSENLSAHGVAYVSYNVYPGWKAREIVRDAMMLRGGPRQEPAEKLSYARGMLEFLDQSAQPESVLKKTLEETLPIVRSASDYYLLHEFLEPCNAPCYFTDFMARAQAQGLAYLADAEPSSMFVENYGEKVRDPLIRECNGNQMLIEQHLDFLVNRMFRQTLLVGQAQAHKIRLRLDPARLRKLSYAGVYQPGDGGVLTLDAQEQVCDALFNRKVTLRQPVHKAVAQVLNERYPASVTADVLLTEVSTRLGVSRASCEAAVLTALEQLLVLGGVRIRRTPVDVVAEVPKFPRALEAIRASSRLNLDSGMQAVTVCTQWHEPVSLSVVERCLLPWLDGNTSYAALAAYLVSLAREGKLNFMRNEQPMIDDDERHFYALQHVEQAIKDLSRKALLVP